MNVFVVLRDYDCEGYGLPLGVFETEKAAILVAKEEVRWDAVEVWEYPVGNPDDGKRIAVVYPGGDVRIDATPLDKAEG